MATIIKPGLFFATKNVNELEILSAEDGWKQALIIMSIGHSLSQTAEEIEGMKHFIS